MRDFDISDMQAAAILGNIGHETNGFQILIERAPVAGVGGIGWGLWTGPRRRAFEEFARQSGLDILSDEANYGFLTHELRTAEKQAVARLKGESTLPDAVRIFELSFLRAPFKRYASREKWAQRALDSYSASTRGTVAEEGNGALPPASPAPSSP